MKLPLLVLSASAFVLAACQPPLEQPWQLTDFRILGIRVEPPEPSRNDDVTVTLVSGDVRDRPVQVLWIACSVPISAAGLVGGGTGNGMDAGSPIGSAGCTVVTPPHSPFPIPDLGTTVTVHIPATGGGLDSSGREIITLLGFACAGGTIGAPSDGGTSPTCNGSGARGWSFTRSIRVHDPMSMDPPNANPEITEVRFGMAGATMPITNDNPPTIPVCRDQSTMNSTCPSYVVEVSYADGSRQTYHSPDPNDGSIVMRTEYMTTGFVITSGTLGGAFRSDSASFPMMNMQDSYRAPEAAGDVHLIVYGTDGRGGFDSTDRHLRVQ